MPEEVKGEGLERAGEAMQQKHDFGLGDATA